MCTFRRRERKHEHERVALGLRVGDFVLDDTAAGAFMTRTLLTGSLIGLALSAGYLVGLIDGRTIVVYQSETHIVEPVELPVCEPLSI